MIDEEKYKIKEEEKGERWTEGDAEVPEGTVGDGHVDGELSVVEGREEGTRLVVA